MILIAVTSRELPVRFEAMKARHLDQVQDIEHQAFSVPWPRYSFLNELNHNEFAHYFVALLGRKVVGYCGMWLVFDEIHVTNVAVHPSYRRRGIGEALLYELIRQGSLRGATRITLEVRASNHTALNLYEKIGFRRTGLRKGYYLDSGEDAIIMWSNLRHFNTGSGYSEESSPAGNKKQGLLADSQGGISVQGQESP